MGGWKGWQPQGLGLGGGLPPGGFGGANPPGGPAMGAPQQAQVTIPQPAPAPVPQNPPMTNQPMPPQQPGRPLVSNRMSELNVPYDEAGSTSSRLFDRYQVRQQAEREAQERARQQQQAMRGTFLNRG
jgi:hypothetical protein